MEKLQKKHEGPNLPDMKDVWKVGRWFLLAWLIVLGILFIHEYWDDIVDEIEDYKISELVEDMNTACREQNYEEAHKCLDKLQTLDNSLFQDIYRECRNKVVREECCYLIAEGDEQSAKRIVYLLLQCYSNALARNEMKRDILELAKTVDNHYVIKLLEKMEDNDNTNK